MCGAGVRADPSCEGEEGMGAAWREENRMRPLLFQAGGRGWVWTLSLSLILIFQVGSQGNSLFPLLSIFKALAAISKKSKAVDCVGLWLPDRKAMKTFQTNVSAHSCPTMEKNLSSLSKWQQQITKIASSASTISHSPLVEDCPSTGPIFLASDRLHCSAFDKLQRQGAHRGWQIGEREKKKPMCTSEFFFLARRCF